MMTGENHAAFTVLCWLCSGLTSQAAAVQHCRQTGAKAEERHRILIRSAEMIAFGQKCIEIDVGISGAGKLRTSILSRLAVFDIPM